MEQLVDRADRAMYAAKSAGRNRVASTSEIGLLLPTLSIGPNVAQNG